MLKRRVTLSLFIFLLLGFFSCKNSAEKDTTKPGENLESAAPSLDEPVDSADVPVSLSDDAGEKNSVGDDRAGLDWPQLLGPNRDGLSAETGLKSNWPSGGPKVIWRKELGTGFSSFSVVDGKAYTMYADGSLEYTVCLDALTGKLLWKTQTDAFFSDYMGGSGPRATPTIANGRLFTLSAYGKLYAMDAGTGAVLWKKDFAKEFGAKPPQWGFCGSPLVRNGRVYIETGGNDGNYVAAFDEKTGSLVWRTKTADDDAPGYSSPITVSVDGISQVVFFTGRRILATKPENGEKLWIHTWITDYNVNAGSPVFVEPNGIFISSGYGRGSAYFKLSASSGSVTAEKVWEDRVLKSRMATPVQNGDYLYGFDASILKCIEAGTGKEMWKQRGYGEGSLIIADGKLILLGDKGNLGIAEATPDGYKELASAEVLDGNKGWTSPALSKGRLYLRNLFEMVCLDLK